MNKSSDPQHLKCGVGCFNACIPAFPPGKAECDRAASPGAHPRRCLPAAGQGALPGEVIPDVLQDGFEEPGGNAVGMAP